MNAGMLIGFLLFFPASSASSAADLRLEVWPDYVTSTDSVTVSLEVTWDSSDASYFILLDELCSIEERTISLFLKVAGVMVSGEAVATTFFHRCVFHDLTSGKYDISARAVILLDDRELFLHGQTSFVVEEALPTPVVMTSWGKLRVIYR
ncbi:MAG: hypothetical protein Q8Q20_05830 [bacterium]|nr:hypothetical protein [bacterium]